jgi:DNA-binding IclR family transcriptional regulator
MTTRLARGGRRYPTPALEKGLDILELFASEQQGLTKTDVARRLGRTVSEVFRMLLCLEERGYIARSKDGERFHLTLQLFRMALEYPPTKRMVVEALPVMQKVAHQLNQSCHLGVLDGGQVVIIAQVDSPSGAGFYVKAGTVVDLMRAATGHVILAHQTPEVCARAVRIWSQQHETDPSQDFQAHLAKIKEHGYEERESYEVSGVINISYPIWDNQGYAAAALTVPYLQRIGDQTTPATVKQVLKQASLQLSEAVGGVVPSGTLSLMAG